MCCFGALLRNMTKNNSFLSKKCFPQQNKLHTAKLSFSAVLNHLYGNWPKKLIEVKKKCFSHENEPHRAILSYSAILKFFFTQIDNKLVIQVKNVIFSSNFAQYSFAKLFYCIETFLQKLTKKLSFRSKKCFSHQNEPHTAILCFSAILKHFNGNWQKTSLFGQKSVFLN